MNNFFDFDVFEKFVQYGMERYEKTAPTVAAYLDDLYIRVAHKPKDVQFVELTRVQRLLVDGEWVPANYAANAIYKLQNELGQDVTGHAGF